MHLVAERSHLLKALTALSRVVERRNTIPILSNVLLTAQDGQLSVRGSDLDLEITDVLPVEVTTEGATTVPAALLTEVVKKSPSGSQIELRLDGGIVHVTVGKSRFKLQALPASDYPTMVTVSALGGGFSHAFMLPARDLRKPLERVAFAASTEETRYYLNGVHLHVPELAPSYEGPAILRAVATDGHRLARTEMPAPDGSVGMPGIIVPSRTVAELLKILDVAGEASIEISSSKIRVTVNTTVLTSKLIDGTFPDYQRVIPISSDHVMTVVPRQLMAAVERVMAIATERGRGVTVAVSPEVAQLRMSSPDAGTASDELAVSFDGKGFEIGFNSRYLRDLSEHLTGDEATFRMTDPGSPALVEDGGDPLSVYVLMPMRV